jgi:hemerythrin superfamily protein
VPRKVDARAFGYVGSTTVPEEEVSVPESVIDLIMNDHREVERIFAQLTQDPATRPNLLPVLTTLLTAHSRAEEAEVYPVARDEAGIAEEVEHSQEEHLEADQLLTKLAETEPDSPGFETALAELVKAVTHHVEEEESKVLPGMQQGLGGDRLLELGEAFAKTRAERLGDQPEDMRVIDLRQQAQNAGIEGASRMNKAELERELKAHAGS